MTRKNDCRGRSLNGDTRGEDRVRGHTFTALKNSFLDFCTGLSDGTDRIADVIVDTGEEERKTKCRRLGKESVAMVKNIAHDIRRDMAGMSFGGVVCDATYGMGKLSGTVRDMDYRGVCHRTTRATGRAFQMMGNVDVGRVFCRASHEIGRLSGITRNALCGNC